MCANIFNEAASTGVSAATSLLACTPHTPRTTLNTLLDLVRCATLGSLSEPRIWCWYRCGVTRMRGGRSGVRVRGYQLREPKQEAAPREQISGSLKLPKSSFAHYMFAFLIRCDKRAKGREIIYRPGVM